MLVCALPSCLFFHNSYVANFLFFHPLSSLHFRTYLEDELEKARTKKMLRQVCMTVLHGYSYRMAQTTQWLPAILDYMKEVKSSISMCFGLVF